MQRLTQFDGAPDRGEGRKVAITGVAGFIGYHLATALCDAGWSVLGVDNFDPYYDVALKRDRLAQLKERPTFSFVQFDCVDERLGSVLATFRPDYVVHLAGQPGVRASVQNPAAYTRANLLGFAQVLEACRLIRPRRLVFASSSSVYGDETSPFREDARTDSPVSYYGATKKANEVMAAGYAATFGLDIVGLRFFSVYGPWGRPDMAPSLFAHAICTGMPIKLFNQGGNFRDFTYVGDIVAGIGGFLESPGKAGSLEIYNLGHNRPVETLRFVELLEQALGRQTAKQMLPAQAGDVFRTCADLTRVHAAIGYEPRISLEDGLREFAAWFQDYYGYEVRAPVAA